ALRAPDAVSCALRRGRAGGRQIARNPCGVRWHRPCNEVGQNNADRRILRMTTTEGGGSLRAYRASISDVVALDRETERDLARRWVRGDKKAGERIVEACLPFVVSIALEYRRWGVPLEDIVQQGNLGLLKAAKKFDPNRECRLATYASYWIRAE